MKIIDWKPIKGFEDLYEISNTGEIRSLDHIRRTGRSEYLQKGKILKSGLNKKTNYLMVSLSKNGKSITKYIHKLVAETFLNNPNDYKYINHKDENTLNNNIENLEWCSQKYNVQHAFKNGLHKPSTHIPKYYRQKSDLASEYIIRHQRKDGFLNLNEWQTKDLLKILEANDAKR